MTTGDEASPLEWRQLQEKAVAVLGDALDWELPGPVWEKKVPGALSDLTLAATARDLPALWRAIGALWLCEGTSRVQTRVGGPPLLPAPLPVRERIAELIDSLTAEGTPESGTGYLADADAISGRAAARSPVRDSSPAVAYPPAAQ